MKNLLAFSIGDPGSSTTITLPGGVNRLLNDNHIITDTVSIILTAMFVFGILLAFLYLLYSGWRYIISQGEKKELEQARTGVVNSLIGLVVIFVSFFIINLIGGF